MPSQVLQSLKSSWLKSKSVLVVCTLHIIVSIGGPFDTRDYIAPIHTVFGAGR